MRFTSTINNSKAIEWKINLSQAYLFSWIYELPSWAEKVIIQGDCYYFASRTKVISELPMLTDKPDTVYRFYKQLEAIDLIITMKIDGKDYVALTEKGKTWNEFKKLGNKSDLSEAVPNELGNKSENDSENFPTYNNTILDNNTNNKNLPSVSENRFSEEVYRTLDKCLEYFPEHLHPKTQKNKENWLDVVDKLNRIDRIPFEVVIQITKAAREDRFWSSNFLAMTKLRQKDKDQIPYIVVFAEKFKPKEQKINRQTEQQIRNTGQTILDAFTKN